MSTTLQAGLYQVLTTNIHEKQIITHTDLLESFITKIAALSLLYVDDIPGVEVIDENRAAYTLLEAYNNRDEIAVMTSESAALYFVDTFRNRRTGIPKYRLLDNALMRFHCTVHLQKGHPIFEVVESWLGRVHAGGFTNKITTELQSRYERAEIKLLDVVIPLDLRDVEIAFYILLFGHTAALICFSIEFILSYPKNNDLGPFVP